jgi:Tol biopolymer transport system component
MRVLDGAAAERLPGTENAEFPFWSPDSRSVGFFADRKVKRIEANGGSVLVIGDTTKPVGGSWGKNGDIIVGQGGGPILRMPASGGKAVPVTKLDAAAHETTHRYPFFLPDGRHFLYLALNLAGAPNDEANQTCVGSLDAVPAVKVTRGYSNPVYASGFLLLARDGDLVAQSFDLANLRVRGEPQTVARQVGYFAGYLDFSQFSASERGILVHSSGALVPTRLEWVDRAGRRLEVVGVPGLYYSPRISPDGQKATVEIFEPNIGKSELWIADLARGSKTRFTSGPSENASAAWSPDGKSIAFNSDRSHQADVYQKDVNGSVDEHALVEAEGQKLVADWSPDGRYILYWEREPAGERRVALKALPLFGDRKPVTVMGLAARDSFQARVSPDGKWIAFCVDDAGRSEIYVTSFPAPAEKWQISSSGGVAPRWRRDGRELFYLSSDGKLMAAEIDTTKGSVKAGVPRVLFETLPPSMIGAEFFDAAPDGQRFLMSLPPDQSTPPLSLVVHWTAALKK